VYREGGVAVVRVAVVGGQMEKVDCLVNSEQGRYRVGDGWVFVLRETNKLVVDICGWKLC